MEYVNADSFLSTIPALPLVDVRSPAEYGKGHLTRAVNIPLFKDDERTIVGTLYKQKGREDAVAKGLEIAEPKMQGLVEAGKAIATDGKLAVHCWRGGMRSNRMAWLFEQNGMTCTVLEGGYKTYRNALLQEFTDMTNLTVLAGQTGSGKTEILHALRDEGEQVLDLEGLANHRGSAFGAIGMGPQPTSQQFQNDLHAELRKLDRQKRIWIERESMTIGKCYLPQPLWESMNRSRLISIDVPLEARIGRLVSYYGNAPKEKLAESIGKLQQRLGNLNMTTALRLLEEDRIAEVAELLLTYYDKGYRFNRRKYAKQKPILLKTTTDDASENARLLINLADAETGRLHLQSQ